MKTVCAYSRVLAALVSVGFAVAFFQLPGRCAKPLRLEPESKPRQLPDHLLGVSVEPSFNHVLDDPRQIAAARNLRPGFVRFPGGTQSNYYQWRRGLFHINVYSNSSEYTKFWGHAMPNAARTNPSGISMERYKQFADSIGAETVLVPNLETSTAENQAAWFRNMREDGCLPTHIEMGNEFYLYMGGDPNVLRIWPNEPTAMERTYQYWQALKPYLWPNSKVAIQSAGSSFGRPNMRHWQDWDQCLKPEPWFDAVTLHLYPHVNEVFGQFWQQASYAEIFRSMMARCDGGVDRVIENTERLLPGKEIWVTEWNTRGAPHTIKEPPMTVAMQAHCTIKMILAYLRHPSLTVSIFFSLHFKENDKNQIYLENQNGDYVPSPLGIVLSWLNEAANGGKSFQEFIEQNGKEVAGGGTVNEDYIPIEGGLFRSANTETFIIQNASNEERSLDLSGIVSGAPTCLEVLTIPFNEPRKLVRPTRLEHPAQTVLLPPYSVIRAIW